MQNFKKLNVWEKAHKLTIKIYRTTASFPREERYGLTNQLCKSSSSIPANIAEGCGRRGGADFARFLYIAMGSACETEYFILLARDLKFFSNKNYTALLGNIKEVKKMLSSLIKKLNT